MAISTVAWLVRDILSFRDGKRAVKSSPLSSPLSAPYYSNPAFLLCWWPPWPRAQGTDSQPVCSRGGGFLHFSLLHFPLQYRCLSVGTYTCWQCRAVSALPGRPWCTTGRAPCTYRSCLRCSGAGRAFEEQECAQLVPQGHCQHVAHCQARPWPWPSSRHGFALFEAGCLHTRHLISFFFFISGFLPGWEAGSMSSFFYIRPIHFFPFVIKTCRRCILHWEHPVDNVSCNIPPVNKTF